MRILHTYKSTNNGNFRDMPEKDAAVDGKQEIYLEWPKWGSTVPSLVDL